MFQIPGPNSNTEGNWREGRREAIPMKRPGKHKVIVYRELIQPICEIALVD
jgi:hypothetical protein